MKAAIVLEALELALSLGDYGPEDIVPEAHLLDMTLTIDPSLMLVPGDAMDHVFDYDPLITEIDRLARDRHYATQEWLLTRIARACAAHAVIQKVELKLYKRPVLRTPDGRGTGTLGVTLALDRAELDALVGAGHATDIVPTARPAG